MSRSSPDQTELTVCMISTSRMRRTVTERMGSLRVVTTYTSVARKMLFAGCMLVVGVVIGTMLVSVQSATKQEEDFVSKVIQHATSGRQRRAVDQTMNRTPSPNGALFTRWGRSVCPPSATLVYTGVMGTGHINHLGGSPEYLCMTKYPEWGRTTGTYGQIFGVEFSSAAHAVCSKDNAPAGLTTQDATCAVCRSRRRVQLMIPGRKTCMAGWTIEYHGYLMGSRYTEKSQRTAVCVDDAPEAEEKGSRSDVGAYLWPLEAACGALPCPNYRAAYELTCVVCSQ